MTTPPTKRFKFSGMIAPDDDRHQPTVASAAAAPPFGASTAAGPPTGPPAPAPPAEHYLAPSVVAVNMIQPADPPLLGVPQYSPTVNGGAANGYNPAGDCWGNFMSYKFQANNNCYAYGCNITTNTFPQPGRQSGYGLPWPFDFPYTDLGQLVSSYAVKDGLQFVGTTMNELLAFQKQQQTGTPPTMPGHFVALMVSPAGDAAWPGDYHWARCDNSNGACDSWSQKDGGDQVTNFDFAGNLITDPSTANWTVNQGPTQAPPPPPEYPVLAGGPGSTTTTPTTPAASTTPPPPQPDQVVEYVFFCYMYVPETGVNII